VVYPEVVVKKKHGDVKQALREKKQKYKIWGKKRDAESRAEFRSSFICQGTGTSTRKQRCDL